MTLYLTDNLPSEEIVRARAAGVVAWLYPQAPPPTTTRGVTDIRKPTRRSKPCKGGHAALGARRKVTSSDIDLFDREAASSSSNSSSRCATRLSPLKIVFTSPPKDAADCVAQADHTPPPSPHHACHHSRNAIFVGGVRFPTACPCSSAKRIAWRWCNTPPVAATSSSGHRQCPLRISEHATGCAGLLPRTPPWRCTPGRLTTRARSTSLPRALPASRPRLLQPAAQHRHHHPAPRSWTPARKLCVWRGQPQAPARWRSVAVAPGVERIDWAAPWLQPCGRETVGGGMPAPVCQCMPRFQ